MIGGVDPRAFERQPVLKYGTALGKLTGQEMMNFRKFTPTKLQGSR